VFATLTKNVRRALGRPGAVDLRSYNKLLPAVESRGTQIKDFTDAELTEEAGRLAEAELPYEREDLAHFLALGREVAERTLGERPYDVQLLGTMALLDGHVAEMGTGEGKTLAGALAAAGFALRGKRVHVLGVNDYLARRDAEWMRPLYELLGLTVDSVTEDSSHEQRIAAYSGDVTYVSVSELGFDVLRDRMRLAADELVLPAPEVALIDEADSVLVDEARVPLVLAGAAESVQGDKAMARQGAKEQSRRAHAIEEPGRKVHQTGEGQELGGKELGDVDLYSEEHSEQLTHLNLALHARVLLKRDVHYVVRDGEVKLIDESRGRIAMLQRWPDGLQAAVETKESLEASDSGEVLDSVTVQALLLRYPTLSGMTGTAMAVADQLREFYELEVAVIPPNTAYVRVDYPTRLFATREEKEDALVAEVAEVHEKGRPILIGTQDVAESERIAERLRREGVECAVLNAKNDAEEASVIAEAGQHGAVTVSTQMAGRGTDIRLGGSDMADRERVAEVGGLYVMGFGRYPSSRLDDQLRGRAGRQGDPGTSRFFVSVEDELITANVPELVGARAEVTAEGEITDAAWRESVDRAQRIAEGQLLELHRNTWRYSQLIDRQRATVLEHRANVVHDGQGARQLALDCPKRYEELVEEVGEDEVARAARLITLYHLDRGWTDHLAFLEELREGIHLRVLGRRDPLDEFNAEAVPVFKGFLDEARSRAAEAFEEAEVVDGAIDVASIGVKRPSSTWTYMVHDRPFGSDMDNVVGHARRVLGNR
jgi:preprotein translocase subunit SecA